MHADLRPRPEGDDALTWRAPGAAGHGTAGGAPAATHVVGGDLPRSTPADAARTLTAAATHAALSTLAITGAPFGSLVAFHLDATGSPLLVVSRIAEHTKNLHVDDRASLLVTEATAGDPLAAGRVSLLGRAVPAGVELKDTTMENVPAARDLLRLGDFGVWRIDLTDVRWVGGFGEMAWLTPADYHEAVVDPILPHRARIVGHMNDDHADAGRLLCEDALGQVVASASMRHVDRFGYEYVAEVADGLAVVRRNFDEPATTVDDVRRHLVAAVREVQS